ncbi:hypothetical protein GCM10009836_47060 [Pseudonocardia ailaonensis]|uniref:Aminoglycoside phosphotransferase domain-containing protein n=1 Tax=Pseudonocardia ailaonensis TaxID=367279 RepID=A0ABN2NCI0_9PSEU
MTWLDGVGRRLGGTPEIVARTPLTGGYASGVVERVDLLVDGRVHTVVLKPADPVEVAAMRAVAVVDPELVAVPRMLATDPLVLEFVDGAADGEVREPVLRTLAAVHRHWFRKRPRGLPVVDASWWRGLCAHVLVALRGAAERAVVAPGDPDAAGSSAAPAGGSAAPAGGSAAPAGRSAAPSGARTAPEPWPTAIAQVTAWAEDPRIVAALALLPKTLCHGDAHRGNMLGDHLIDWGNARVAPAGLDLAVIEAQGAVDLGPYRVLFPEGPLAEVEREWARVHAHVQYLGFAADHLGAARVAEMLDTAAEALARLGPALTAAPR